mgnify:CR=1 FL=1
MTFEQWHEKHKDEVIRLWTDKTDPDEVCELVYITEIVDTGEGIMIGVQTADDTYDDARYPMIDYLMLRDVTLMISAKDQEVAV